MKRLFFIVPMLVAALVFAENQPSTSLRTQAVANYRAGHYEKAAALYEQLLKQEPENEGLVRDYMWVLWKSERFRESAEAAARLLELHSEDAEAKGIITKASAAMLRSEAVKNYKAKNYAQAARSYAKLLEASPQDRTLLKDLYWSYWETKSFDKAEAVALQFCRHYPADADAWNMLGRAYAANSKPAEAQAAYQKSLTIKQDQPNAYSAITQAQYNEARTLYYAGDIPVALSKFQQILKEGGPKKEAALDFLVDDSLVNHDLVGAEKLLADFLVEVTPQNEPRLLKLASIYLEDRKLTEFFKVIDRYLKLTPENIGALLMKADVLYSSGRYSEAAKIYQKIQTLNPYSIRAFDGLANAEEAMGHPDRALRVFQSALQLDPTDPYLIILQSHYLDVNKRIQESQEVLLNWLAKNKEPVLPVLLYHGLTPYKRDPMLAYSVHMELGVFEDQMRAIKAAGYTPVSSDQVVAWYKSNEPLPKKPILITFDDGRLDSLRNADPVLKKYDLKGTMFIPMANIEGSLPLYATWGQIVEYESSGRWDFQSHGDKGHARIPIDAQGRQGLFLINKRWLENENRLETTAEWKKRIADDHQSEKKKMLKALGKNPLSYAYPEGSYGQIDTVNSPEAVPLNLEVTAKEFEVAYHQDRFGLNAHSRNPMFLTRLEPHADWSGEELVAYLQDNNPVVVMNRELLRQSVWNGRIRKASGFLKDMKEAGASRQLLKEEEKRIYSSLDEFKGRPFWAPGYTFTEDNRTRRSSIFEQTLRPFPFSKLNLDLLYMYGTFKENGVPDITENAAGLGLEQQLSLFHSVGARAMWHWFPDHVAIKDTYSGSAYLNSNWNDGVRTELKAGRTLYNTARALKAGVIERYAQANGWWRQEGPWSAFGKLHGSNLSDENRRYGVEAGFSRSLISDFRGIFRYTFENMDKVSPDYYSPQQLHQQQVGLEYSLKAGWFRPLISYLPGIGKERGTGSEFIQNVQASFLVRLGVRTTIQPLFDYVQTPTYRRNTYNVVLNHSF